MGTAEEIYLRANQLIEEMIIEILINEPTPLPQNGKVVKFKRREPNQSKINNLKSLNDFYDFIRMLDADGYPRAFIEHGNFKIEFSRASLKVDSIVADVTIKRNLEDE